MRDLFETILMFLVFLVIGLAVFIWWFEHKTAHIGNYIEGRPYMSADTTQEWKNQHKYDLRL